MDDKKRVTLLVLNDYLKFDRKIYQLFGVSLGRAISLKAILYFFVAVIVEIVFYFIPLIGSILHVLPAVFLLAIPIGVSYLLTGVRTEGRNPIAFFRSVFLYQLRKTEKVTYYRGREIAKPAVFRFNGYATVNYSTQEEILKVLDQPINISVSKRKSKKVVKKQVKKPNVKERKEKVKRKKVVGSIPKMVMQISSHKEPINKTNLLQPIGLFHKELESKNESSIQVIHQFEEKKHDEITTSGCAETVLNKNGIEVPFEKENGLQGHLISLNTEETKKIGEKENNEIVDISDIEHKAPINLRVDIEHTEHIEGISDIEASMTEYNYPFDEVPTQPFLAEESSQVITQLKEVRVEEFEEVDETIIKSKIESQESSPQKIEKKIIRLPIFKWGKSKQKSLPKTGTTGEETIEEVQQEEKSNVHLTQQHMMNQMLLQQNRPSITDLKSQLKEEKRQQRLEKKFEKVMKKGDY